MAPTRAQLSPTIYNYVQFKHYGVDGKPTGLIMDICVNDLGHANLWTFGWLQIGFNVQRVLLWNLCAETFKCKFKTLRQTLHSRTSLESPDILFQILFLKPSNNVPLLGNDIFLGLPSPSICSNLGLVLHKRIQCVPPSSPSIQGYPVASTECECMPASMDAFGTCGQPNTI